MERIRLEEADLHFSLPLAMSTSPRTPAIQATLDGSTPGNDMYVQYNTERDTLRQIAIFTLGAGFDQGIIESTCAQYCRTVSSYSNPSNRASQVYNKEPPTSTCSYPNDQDEVLTCVWSGVQNTTDDKQLLLMTTAYCCLLMTSTTHCRGRYITVKVLLTKV